MRRLTLITLVAVAAAVAGCGGSSSPEPAPGSPQHPLVATTQVPAPAAATSPKASAGHSNEAAGKGSTKHGSTGAKGTGSAPTAAGTEAGQPSETPGYTKLLEQQSASKGTRFTPCNLVSERRAAAILGEPIQQPLLAPQGPTCIYRTQDGKGFVTVAVQSVSFTKLQRQVQHPQRYTVSGVTALCGRLGQSVLYAPLKGGRVLSITAPCAVARQFAATAMPQLG